MSDDIINDEGLTLKAEAPNRPGRPEGAKNKIVTQEDIDDVVLKQHKVVMRVFNKLLKSNDEAILLQTFKTGYGLLKEAMDRRDDHERAKYLKWKLEQGLAEARKAEAAKGKVPNKKVLDFKKQ